MTSESTTPNAPSRDLSLGPFARIFAASLAAHLGAFLFIHLPDFMKELGATETTNGAAAGTCALFAIVTRPFVGRVMDTRGRRAPLIVGGVLHAITCALYLTVDSIDAWLFVVRAMQGIAFGIFFSVVFTVASDLAPEDARTQRLAVFGISGILPMSLGALLGDFLVRHWGYGTMFAVASLCGALATVFAASVPETSPTLGDAATPDPIAAFREPGLRWLWVAGLLFAIAIASYFVFAKNFLVGEHLGEMGTFFTPYAVVAIFVRVIFGDLPRRMGEHNTFPLALLLLGVGLVALSAATSPTTVSVAGALCGLGHAFAFPSLMTLFVERSDPAIRGSVVAMFTALMDMGQLAAGPLFGRTADRHGFRMVFDVAALVALAAFVLFVARARKLEPTPLPDVESSSGFD